MPGTRRSRARCLGSLPLLLLLAGAGDPVRGEAVVTRQSSTCTLCHAGPFPNPHLQGDVGPDLRGVGARLSESELRDRLVDASRVNPDDRDAVLLSY